MYWANPCSPAVPSLNTGWFRNGSCETDANDGGRHVICAQMTDAFLGFQQIDGQRLKHPDAGIQLPRA